MLEKCDNVDSCAILEACGKHFCSTLDLKNIKWQDIFQHFAELESDDCEKHQEKLIKVTIESELNVEYPVRSTYQLSFLKHCITQAEKSNLEFAKAYELYIKLLHDKSLCGEETSYKHYFLGDKPITLKENNSFISGGTTGLCTWQAGIALANWCLSYGNVLLSKRVVELGCGAGLTGLVILQSDFLPKEYVFTDSHPLVLQQLKSNLEINIPGDSWPRIVKNTQVDVTDFDWGDETKIKDFSEADIFLGADIVYDSELVDLLADTLERLLDSDKKCAIIACTVRNLDTIEYFINAVENRALSVSEDTSCYPSVIEGISSPVKIYVIKKASSQV